MHWLTWKMIIDWSFVCFLDNCTYSWWSWIGRQQSSERLGWKVYSKFEWLSCYRWDFTTCSQHWCFSNCTAYYQTLGKTTWDLLQRDGFPWWCGMGHVGCSDMSALSQCMCSCYCQSILQDYVSVEMATASIIETNWRWSFASACLESKGNEKQSLFWSLTHIQTLTTFSFSFLASCILQTRVIECQSSHQLIHPCAQHTTSLIRHVLSWSRNSNELQTRWMLSWSGQESG